MTARPEPARLTSTMHSPRDTTPAMSDSLRLDVSHRQPSLLSRRGVLTALGGLTAGALAGPALAWAGKAPFFQAMDLPIGLQLYTLGAALRDDLDGQLGEVGRIGY